MLVTSDESLYQRVRVLRDHGRPPGDRLFLNSEVAYKYKMSAMQAGLGLAQLERIQELVQRKRQIFDWYQSELAAVEGIQLNIEKPETVNSYWMVTVTWGDRYNFEKEEIMQHLSEKGIDSRPFFNPLSSLPAFANCPDAQRAAKQNQVSYAVSRSGINLPSALTLTESQVHTVCQELKSILSCHV